MAPALVLPTPMPPAPVLPESTATQTSPAAALTPLVKDVFTTSTLSFYLNGTKLLLKDVDPEATLLDFIRSQRGLKGTKLGCGEGGCGACTVVVQQAVRGRVQHLAVNACLAPIISGKSWYQPMEDLVADETSVEGKHIITVEALGNADNPHPLQERLARLHGSQCGFCTPGIIMSLYALLRNAYDPDTKTYRLTEEMVEMEGALDGNLCRCTGYKPILEAAKSFVREELNGVVLEGPQSASETPEDGLGGNWTADAHVPKQESCGRPGGCCRDKAASPSSEDEERESASSTEGEKESSAATTPDEVPLSGAEYGAPTRMFCGREDYCQLPISGKSKATTEVKALPAKSGRYDFPQFNFKTYEPHTEIIFPPALRKHELRPLCFGNERKIWFRPTTLAQLLQVKDAFPSAKLVAGSSEVQVEIKFKNSQFAVAVYVGDVEELKGFEVDESKGEVVIGGNSSLSEVEAQCLTWAEKLGRRGLVLEAARKQLRYFAGRQVRSCSGGGLTYADPGATL